MTSFDLDVDGVLEVLEKVWPEADTMSEKGSQATTNGNAIEGQCGTAVDVAAAFSALWSSRSEVGTRAADYAQACADAVGMASAAISDQDDLMDDNAGMALSSVDPVQQPLKVHV